MTTRVYRSQLQYNYSRYDILNSFEYVLAVVLCGVLKRHKYKNDQTHDKLGSTLICTSSIWTWAIYDRIRRLDSFGTLV